MQKITSPIAVAIYLFCSLITSSCSDSKIKAQPEHQKETTTEKPAVPVITDRHVNIPNSSLYIIPPAGFAVEEVSGTLSETNGTAHYMQMTIFSGETQQSLFAKFKSEADKNFPGSWKEEVITVNGHTATIYHCKTAAYSQYFMAFTDSYTDEMIIANYEEKEAATATAMYEALKTVVAKK